LSVGTGNPVNPSFQAARQPVPEHENPLGRWYAAGHICGMNSSIVPLPELQP